MPPNLDAVLTDVGVGTYHVLQFVILSAITLADGAEIMMSSAVLATLQEVWHLSHMQKGAMMSVIFVGVCLGGILGGNLADVHGRRIVSLASMAGLVIFGVLCAGAPGPIVMLLCRLGFGSMFGLGVSPALALLVECAPAMWRGHLINLSGLTFALGEVYAAVLLMIFLPKLSYEPEHPNNWRIATAMSATIPLLLLPFAVVLLKESPHWLVSHGRDDEAAEVLKSIARMNGKSDSLRFLTSSPDVEGASEVTGTADVPSDTSRLLAPAADDAGTSEATGGAGVTEAAPSYGATGSSSPAPSEHVTLPLRERLTVCFGPEYRKIVIGGSYLCFLSNLWFYGLSYALPQIFHLLGSQVEPAQQVLLISLCDIPGVVLAFLLIRSQEISHRDSIKVLAAASGVLSLSLSTIDQGEDWLWAALPSAYLAKYVSSALFTLAYVYLSEVFPAACRCTALSCCIASGRIGSICAPMLFEALAWKDFKYGKHIAFLMLTATLCFVAIAVVETMLTFELKGKPLEDLGSQGGTGRKRRPSVLKSPRGSCSGSALSAPQGNPQDS